MGAFNSSSQGGWYRRLTVSGIMKQCNAFGANITSLSRMIADISEKELLETLTNTDADGIVWLLPEPQHWKIIEDLVKSKVNLVLVRNSHGNDGFASVEVDYERVGFEAGRFLIDKGCEGVLLFTRLKADLTSEIALKHGFWPSNISFGFHKSFHCFDGNTSHESVIELPLGGSYSKALRKFSQALQNYSSDYGLFFIDPMYLAHFLVHTGNEGVKAIKDRKIVMINNWDNYSIFSPYADSLDIYSFMDQPEEVGVLAVQKLSSLVDGHLANTVTSLQLSLKKYSTKNSIQKLVEEIDVREIEDF